MVTSFCDSVTAEIADGCFSMVRMKMQGKEENNC